jgi:hypothetical protein
MAQEARATQLLRAVVHDYRDRIVLEYNPRHGEFEPLCCIGEVRQAW